MKYFKITLGKDTAGIIYPDNYQREIGDYAEDHLYYKEGATDYLLLCIPDDKSGSVVRKNVVEVTEAEAKAISENNEPRTEQVTDEAKVRRLELKASLGESLTTDELKALDPDDPTLGFGKREILSDRINELKTR